jgi:hypothetical protein
MQFESGSSLCCHSAQVVLHSASTITATHNAQPTNAYAYYVLQVGGLELCSLDLLHCAGLVNYFGQNKEADQAVINPILLQKGTTKLVSCSTEVA